MIFQGMILNKHEFHRNEANFYILRTLRVTGGILVKQIDIMFNRQISTKLLIANLREIWAIDYEDFDYIKMFKGYEPDYCRRRMCSPPPNISYLEMLEFDSEGNIIDYTPISSTEKEDLEENQ